MRAEDDIQRISGFLERLGLLSASFHHDRSAKAKAALSGFLPEVARLNAPIRAAKKREAPNYNLFHVLKIRHYEARVHTPFLVNLLSPTGSHSQGDLFYKTFLEQVLLEKVDAKFLCHERLEVTDEHYAGEGLGYIDIWIRNHSHLDRYCIIIENKIRARDQELQLERYYRYAEGLGFEPKDIRLFYLTLWPTRAADEYTISTKLRIELEDLLVLRYISYREDILPWLHSIKDKVEAPVVRTMIQQYIRTIYSLL